MVCISSSSRWKEQSIFFLIARTNCDNQRPDPQSLTLLHCLFLNSHHHHHHHHQPRLGSFVKKEKEKKDNHQNKISEHMRQARGVGWSISIVVKNLTLIFRNGAKKSGHFHSQVLMKPNCCVRPLSRYSSHSSIGNAIFFIYNFGRSRCRTRKFSNIMLIFWTLLFPHST